MSSLSNDEVHKICKMMESGFSNKQICDEFGFKDKKEREKFRSVIKHIRKRKTWIPISKQYIF